MKLLFLLGMFVATPVFAGLTDKQIDKLNQVMNEQAGDYAGLLYVKGTLSEGTCRMSMESEWQEVNLGNATRADLKILRQTDATPITIYLDDCPGKVSTLINPILMTQARNAGGTAYQARFVAVADETNPDLIKVKGASGIGLLLRDEEGRKVRLSQRGYPILLAPGRNQVTYTIQPARTLAEFVPGAYHAVINFSMMYQ